MNTANNLKKLHTGADLYFNKGSNLTQAAYQAGVFRDSLKNFIEGKSYKDEPRNFKLKPARNKELYIVGHKYWAILPVGKNGSLTVSTRVYNQGEPKENCFYSRERAKNALSRLYTIFKNEEYHANRDRKREAIETRHRLYGKLPKKHHKKALHMFQTGYSVQNISNEFEVWSSAITDFLLEVGAIDKNYSLTTNKKYQENIKARKQYGNFAEVFKASKRLHKEILCQEKQLQER